MYNIETHNEICYQASVFEALKIESGQAFFIGEIVTPMYALGKSALDAFKL